MKATVYLSRKLLNQLKVKETESKDLMLTHNLHNIIINGKRVGCSGHIQNVLNNKCVYVSTEKSCYQPLSDKNLVRYAAQPEPEVKANSDIRSVASDICDVFENYLDENGVYIVCDDADEEQDRKANESGAMLYGMEYWHLVEDVEFRVNHINAQYKLFTVFDIMEAFDKLLISKKLGDFVPSGENRYRLYAKILSCLRSIREKL